MKQTPNLQGLWVSCQQEASPPCCRPARACRLLSGGQPQPRGQTSAWTGVSLCGARGGRARSLYSVTCPHKARRWDLGHGCAWTGQTQAQSSGPHWSAADNSGSFTQEAQELSSGAAPKWPTPRKPVASQTHTTRVQRERQAARWQRKRVCSEGRGPGTRGRERAGAKVSMQPLPTTLAFPGQAGRAGGWPLCEFQPVGEGRRPLPGELAHPCTQRPDGRAHRWIHLFQLTSWGNTRPSRRVQSSVGS